MISKEILVSKLHDYKIKKFMYILLEKEFDNESFAPVIEWKSEGNRELKIRPITKTRKLEERGFFSSGTTFGDGHIIIRIGKDHIDAMIVCLHELAHYKVGIQEKHNSVFYKEYLSLIRKHNPELEERMMQRESVYKPNNFRLAFGEH